MLFCFFKRNHPLWHLYIINILSPMPEPISFHITRIHAIYEKIRFLSPMVMPVSWVKKNEFLCMSHIGAIFSSEKPISLPDIHCTAAGTAAHPPHTDCKAERAVPDVRAGRRRSSWPQPHFPDHSMSPSCRLQRQPDRICRRNRQENEAADFGTYRYVDFTHTLKRHSPVTILPKF